MARPRKLPREVVDKRYEERREAVEKAVPQPVEGRPAPHAIVHAAEETARKSNIMDAFAAPDGVPVVDRNVQALQRELEILEATEIQEKRALAKESFWFFLTEVLFPNTWQENYSPEFHKPLCDELQGLQKGEDFWLFMQREARKTFIFDIAYTLWLIVHDPDIRILLIGARLDTIKPFARLIRSAFIPGTPGFEEFQRVYADFTFDAQQVKDKKLNQALQFTIPGRTKALPDPTFRAAFLGVTGAGWRCDVLIFDDSIERKKASNPDQSRSALRDMLDLIPLIHSGSEYENLIGLGTRWAYHDPYGRFIGEVVGGDDETKEIQDRFTKGKVRVIIRHAVELPNRLCEHCPKHIVQAYPHGHPTSPYDAEGEATCSGIWTKEMLQARLEKYRTDPTLGESLWYHQYNNVCLSPADQKVKPEWFFDVDIVDWPVSKRRVLSIDSADKNFQQPGSGDYMVALMGGFDDYGRLMMRHGVRSRQWTRDEFIRQIISWCVATGWWPNTVVKEKVATDTFLTDICRAFLNYQRPCVPFPVPRATAGPNTLKKADWIVEAVQGPLERGEIVWGSKFPKDLRERASYETCNLGQVSHDDVADTLALFFVPGVRIELPFRSVGTAQQWRPPELSLYEPGRRTPPQPLFAPPPEDPVLDSLRNTSRIAVGIDEMGFGRNVRWDPPSRPEFLGADMVFDR